MTIRRLLEFAHALAALGASAATAQVVIKLGSVAPEGSIWHDALLETRQRWRDISSGEVDLKIYAGGVLGGEEEMIRKMQRRGLDALAVSGSGLPLIDGIVSCMNDSSSFVERDPHACINAGPCSGAASPWPARFAR